MKKKVRKDWQIILDLYGFRRIVRMNELLPYISIPVIMPLEIFTSSSENVSSYPCHTILRFKYFFKDTKRKRGYYHYEDRIA